MKSESLGKRKTAVAKVFLENGSGKIIINNKPYLEYFKGVSNEVELIKSPLILLNLQDKYDLKIFVKGGGITGQLEAIKLSISKVLCKVNNDYRQLLSQNLFLRRDSRIKERRKYGLKKARKAPQYSKR